MTASFTDQVNIICSYLKLEQVGTRGLVRIKDTPFADLNGGGLGFYTTPTFDTSWDWVLTAWLPIQARYEKIFSRPWCDNSKCLEFFSNVATENIEGALNCICDGIEWLEQYDNNRAHDPE
jgi:hypothetical protein